MTDRPGPPYSMRPGVDLPGGDEGDEERASTLQTASRYLRSLVDRLPEGRATRVVEVAQELVAEWRRDRVPDLAAGVAFWAFLSLFPALLTLATVLGTLDSLVGVEVAERVEDEVLDYLREILTDDASGTVDAVQELFDTSSAGLLTFTLVVAVWTLSRGFAGLIRALDAIYEVRERRSWLRIRGTALALSVGSVLAAAVMLSLLVVGPLLGSGEDVADTIGLGDVFAFVWDVLRPPLAVALLVGWAATVFHLAPDQRTPWRWDLPGAVLTTVLWVVVSIGLRVYLYVAATGNEVFGVVGGVADRAVVVLAAGARRARRRRAQRAPRTRP